MSDSKEHLTFQAFDPGAELACESRYLPHWFQPKVATFITFRTIDSMPRYIVEEWQREIADWLVSKGRGPHSTNAPLPPAEQLPSQLRAEYRRVRDLGWHSRLDQCRGTCLLRNPTLRQIVVDSIGNFHGERYQIDSLVVMPNHVHLIVQFHKGYRLRKEAAGWLRFTARKLNEAIGRKGPFWQGEPFDHLIRSERQFHYLRDYIKHNPKRAKLGDGEFSLVQF